MALLIITITLVLMECLTWRSHQYLMHGVLWTLPDDHPQPKSDSVFEKNNAFFVITAIPSLALFAAGTFNITSAGHIFV
jgi:beta-carotene 3-hydroxylase